MKNFFEYLYEAKVKPALTRTVPEAPGELAFRNMHTIKDILANFRAAGCDKTFFNGGDTKTFNRAGNRFGRNTTQSIKDYDKELPESENLEEERKTKKRHVFINGKWVGTTSWSRTNKEALKNYRSVHPEVHSTKVKLAREGLDEVLTKDTSIKTFIDDFINSDNPKFEGKSKEKRRKMAIAAYYSKQNEEHIKEAKWIQKAIKHPGALTRKAKAAGESNSEFEQEHKHDSGKTGDQARLALTLKKMHEENLNEIAPNRMGAMIRAAKKREAKEKLKKAKEEASKEKKVNENLARSTQKRFADSKGKMNQSDAIDKKSEKKDKVKELISKMRKKD